jgi:hypothetical protein
MKRKTSTIMLKAFVALKALVMMHVNFRHHAQRVHSPQGSATHRPGTRHQLPDLVTIIANKSGLKPAVRPTSS